MTGKALSTGHSQVPGRDFGRSQVSRRLMLNVLAGGVVLWGAAALGVARAPDAGAAPPAST
ncbi:MAG TPA: hypothetical protein VFQ44_20785 [Streptosporangiaceae bacterium]|nr:hypothetical protein [Streptosporangiaceae bacterium]